MSRTDDSLGVLLGGAALVGIAAADLLLPKGINFSGDVVVAPVLTGSVAGPRPTAGVAVAAGAASVALSVFDGQSLGPTVVRLVVVLIGSATSIWISHRRVSQEERYTAVKTMADVAQRALLHPLPERVGPAGLGSCYISATHDALVGGDFYEVVEYGDAARWIVGDVKGKGLDAVRVAAVALGTFREAAETLPDLTDVAQRVDDRVSRELGDEDFVTACTCELHPDGTLIVVNCGHLAPWRIGALPAVPLETPPTTPLGLSPKPAASTFTVAEGECVWTFTDGVTEARTPAGRGVDPADLTAGVDHQDASGVCAGLLERLSALVDDHFEDDTAMIVAQLLPAGEAPAG